MAARLVESKSVEAFRLRDVRWVFSLRIPHCDHFFFVLQSSGETLHGLKKEKTLTQSDPDFINYLVV